MVIERISGNAQDIPQARKGDAGGNASFDKVLSNRTSAAATDGAGGGASAELSSEEEAGAVSTPALVKIGTITSKNPTVSNLLIRNPALKNECWNIVYAEQNRDKAYTRIPTGTDVYYDPATRELLWGDMVAEGSDAALASAPAVSDEAALETAASGQAATGTETGTGGLCDNLVDAVRSMIGKTYSDMNCYELLANGLDNMGVRYYGQGGLGDRMVTGALQKGLPMNAYLNGEGLIKFSGSETYHKSFMKVTDPVGQAKQVIEEIAAHLEKGSILSFSTESRGHTGVVSNRDGRWTFINSGVMDNPVEAVATTKGVGEESLGEEIENWFKLAARKNESLVITLGKLSSSKLAAYEGGREIAVS